MLHEVSINETATPPAILQETPLQQVSAHRIEQSGASQLSDILRTMAGVTLKDYGGIGGMKTISARGLGSPFSMLTIDGIAVSDYQNGQIDLGRYLLGNTAQITFANGNNASLLQSASSLSASNIVAITTATPHFDGKNTNIRLGAEGGSFGLLSPSITIEQRVNDRFSISLWGNLLRSSGDYPYTTYQASADGDNLITLHRQNSAMWMTTADANLFYTPSTRQLLTAKIHYMQARHELPGAVTYYKTKAASDHTEDQLVFAQIRHYIAWHQDSNGIARLQLQTLGKYQLSNTIYEDTFSYSPLHNNYRQQEGYLASTLLYSPTKHLQLSIAEDLKANTLQSNLARNDRVCRLSSLTALSAAYQGQRLSASARLVATLVNEQATTTASSITDHYALQRLTPYIGLSFAPLRNNNLRLRYFYKHNYRLPTFNEMYYLITSHHLLPEQARQHNIGIAYHYADRSHLLQQLNISVDAYHNNVNDKIIAIPTHNMFVWSMINLGKVAINGIDISADASLSFADEWSLSLYANYTYQHATDRTLPKQKSYGHQIPYTPRHSASSSLTLQTPLADLGYDITIVGSRYTLTQNTPQNRLNAYADQGISLSRTFRLKYGSLRLQGRILNLFDVHYEVARSYPMMGRNYRLSITYKF